MYSGSRRALALGAVSAIAVAELRRRRAPLAAAPATARRPPTRATPVASVLYVPRPAVTTSTGPVVTAQSAPPTRVISRAGHARGSARHRARRRAGVVRGGLVAAGLALIAAGATQGYAGDRAPVAAPVVQQRVAAETSSVVTHEPQHLSAPVRLRIPRLSVDAPVVRIGVTPTGVLQPPEPPSRVGWWRDSALPGADVGSTVITGHVDSARYGTGALFNARTLHPGDKVLLTLADRSTATYRVVLLTDYRKHGFPSQDVLSQTVRPSRLVLITCDGVFDRSTGHYLDNLVVYAARVS